MLDLKTLAQRYETREFLAGDPSWFMHQVEGEANKELLAFIASALSYGSRKQFMPKIQRILECSSGNVEQWLAAGIYRADIPDNEECYYRLYTNHTMRTFLNALAEMVRQHGSMKNYVRQELEKLPPYPSMQAIDAVEAITRWFSQISSKAMGNNANVGAGGSVIPKDAASSCKRICMFLRWMVRDGSPVDLGLWSDIIDKRTLIIPLDTHVLQEATRIGLLASKSTSMSTAMRLTDKLRDIFPSDPLKGDFALFGIGVDETIRN